jgi:hypothetical protein
VSSPKKKISLKERLLLILKDNPSPHQIALGIAIGVFMALSPFLGVHLIGAIGLSLLFGGNKLAAGLSVWISNPITFAPTILLQYFLGCEVLPHYQVDNEIFHDFLKEPDLSGFWRMGAELFVPYVAGSMISALVLGAASYFFSVWLIRWMKKRKILFK